MQELKANTAVDVLIGPFVDSTDGDTAETALTIAQADVRLSKNAQNMAQKSDVTACVHDELGYYNCELDATDTNTEGTLVLAVHEAGALPVRHEFMVLSEAAYDSKYEAKDTGYMQVNLAPGAVDNASLAGNMEIVFETDFATNYDTTNNYWVALLADDANHGGSAFLLTGDRLAFTSTSGACASFTGAAGNNAGILALGGTNGPGIFARGGANDGSGILAQAQAGSSDTAGIEGQGSGGNASGIRGNGNGTGAGMTLVGGVNGDGVSLNGQGTGVNFDYDAAGTELSIAVVDNWESQSQADPTGFHVNVLEVGGTAQTANDNGADINAILTDTADMQPILTGIGARANNSNLNALLGVADSAGVTIVTHVGDVETDTQNIQSRIPAALVSGNMSSDTVALSGSTTAADNLEQGALALVTGAASGTPTTTVIDTDLTEASDDHYNGRVCTFTSGVCAGETRTINDYNGTSKELTTDAFQTAPSASDTFVIS